MEYHIECPEEDFDLILTEYKEIPLTQGKVAFVDVEDYDYLNQWKWHVLNYKYTCYTARSFRKNGKRNLLRMHREIMKPFKDMQIDHINRDGLDNRRNNLRICTRSQNQMNRKINCNNTSGYMGVRWHIRSKKWMAQIQVCGKRKHLGCFASKEEAALAYNEMKIHQTQ